MKIGLFYGSSTCYTEMAAEKIRDTLGESLIELHNVKDTPLKRMETYDILILGIPTWDFGELQEDWAAAWPTLSTLNLHDKIVALFGMGDQLAYGEWFLDALGMLYDNLLVMGVRLVGLWPTIGYTFTSQKAVLKSSIGATTEENFFVGLALDDANQYEQSDERIHQWCEQIMLEIAELL